MSLWTDLRDTAESAVVIAGNYVLPGSSLITSKLVSDGSQEQLNSDLGILAQLGSAGAGAWNGNLANYQTAANSILGSVSPGTTVESLSQATGLSGTQLARLGITAASLLAGGSAIANATGGTGGLNLTTQDRSGFSAGSANYSPEYYTAIQSKYNQYMPQQQGKDITTDLKNWYETKYTPQANVAAAPTLTTTGTGYTTPTTLTNLGINPQTVAPSYTALAPTTSTANNIGTEYANFIASRGGNTVANRSEALAYLQNKGFTQDQIDAGYNAYLSSLPTATGTTAETLAANASPAQIAQAYAGYASSNGGDTVANRQAAINYLVNLGVPQATIQAAYPIYQASVQPSSQSTGMLTGSAAPSVSPTSTAQAGSSTAGATPASMGTQTQPSYTSLTSASSPAAIAAAYRDFVAGSGGDTATNREAAINYLNNLGVSNDTIGQAYGLFKG